MKWQTLRKLFTFLILMMMFFALPQLANAQNNKPCPKGYRQECYYYTCPLCARGEWIYVCVPYSNARNSFNNTTGPQSIAARFELDHPLVSSIKVYDVTGRLVKSIADRRMKEGENQMEWNAKDENGNRIPAVTYIIQFKSGDIIKTTTLSVVK